MMSYIFLQGGAGGNEFLRMILLFGPILLVFWFFFIRPQAKKQKEQTAFAEGLEKGQEVVTVSGILGRINKIEGGIITLEVGTKTYLRITKNSISKEMTEAIHGKEKKKGPIEVE